MKANRTLAVEPIGKKTEDCQEPRRADQARRLHKLYGEHHRLSLRVEELEHELELLTHSLSWKLTAPLRAAKPWLGYLRSLCSLGKHLMAPNPFNDLIPQGAQYVATGPVPYFILESSKGRMPVGWVEIELAKCDTTTHTEFSLYVDEGLGFSENSRLNLSFLNKPKVLIKLPRFVKTLRLDPVGVQADSSAASFKLHGLHIREFSGLKIFFRLFFERLAVQKATSGSGGKFLRDACAVFFRGGKIAFKHFVLLEKLSRRDYNLAYQKWIRKYDTISKAEREKLTARYKSFEMQPLISVLMPVYNTPEKWLRKAVDSVLGQIYPNWELCISDDASTRPSVKAILKEYQLRDSRIKVVFREQNEHISESSNSALAMATGQYIALMDHDDELPEHALYLVAREINLHPEVDLIFSDEDRISKAGKRLDPYFKLGWNRELFLAQNCVSHLGVYRAELAKQVKFRAGYEGSQDWDFALRFLEHTGDDKLRHIPHVLYHWRLVPGTVSFDVDTKLDAFDAGQKAVEDYYGRNRMDVALSKDSRSGFLRARYTCPPLKRSITIVAEYAGERSFKRLLTSVFENSSDEVSAILAIGLGGHEKIEAEIRAYCKEQGVVLYVPRGDNLKAEILELGQGGY
ncbi:glycosyltransferase, partial [Oligoflexia bacterium]|nr:glycosyltransferase [Oligoflexia bacterium]